MEQPWAIPWEQVAAGLESDAEQGLSGQEVSLRRKRFGLNRLRQVKRVSPWAILFSQFRSLIVLFLGAAVVVALLFGELADSLAITAVIFINALIGFVTELKGARSVEALRQLGNVTARVRRNRAIREVAAEDLVPGDVAVMEGGDIITADIRLFKASKLQADESTLTGESLPVAKETAPTAPQTALADRVNMLFKGTTLTRGSGEGIVVSTGMNTELGQISRLVEETEEEATPLERRLNQLGRWLIWLSLLIAGFVAVSGIMAGKDAFLMIETAVALAVAAIPEGLPIVATIALARGVWRMARRNALIKRLSAVETLGATNVIVTDKTGTLTENRMTVSHLSLASGELDVSTDSAAGAMFSRDGRPVSPAGDGLLSRIFTVSVLCNNASLGSDGGAAGGKPAGDPLEIALLEFAERAGVRQAALTANLPEVREEAFDADTRMMATFHRADGNCLVAVKGAPEAVLKACSQVMTADGTRPLSEAERESWLARNRATAARGLRVLAMATKEAAGQDAPPYEDLVLLGLVGLMDPPREGIREAIGTCRAAGISVIMATGDQEPTARTIAAAIGLLEGGEDRILHGSRFAETREMRDDEKRRLLQMVIFSRMSPKQKLDLIELHQENGSIVAMTGDGVNDAPALKKADIGIAMGRRGTQVAREASDMILTDDSFNSIVLAVGQGRVIFDNIRKFVLYLLSCNVSEILIVGLAAVVNAPLPLLPLQILFLNIVTDVFPALALAGCEGDHDVMRHPPRSRAEPIMARRHWRAVGLYGLILTGSVLGALAVALRMLGMAQSQAVTISFLTLGFGQLWHVFNMRAPGSGLWRNDITRNGFVWAALALCTFLLLATVYLPGLSTVLKVADPGREGWLLIAGMSLLPLVLGQIFVSRLSGGRESAGESG